MIIQNERPQSKRLNRLGLRILTAFWDNGSVRQRSSDHSVQDDIADGVIMNKQYFRGEQLLHTEKEFNPLLKYSFVIQDQMKKEITCPNCGKTGETIEFGDGCPYCGTYYNIGYSERKNAGKLSAEKKALPSSEYIPALILLLAVFLLLGLLLVRITGRTFSIFDVLKGLAFGAIAGLLSFYAYYSSRISAFTRKEEANYQRQLAQIRTFEARLSAFDIPVNVFYTNLCSELDRHFFEGSDPENADIIDWDILDYDEYTVSGDRESNLAVSLSAELRMIRARENRIQPKKIRIHAVMKPNPVSEDPLQPGVNVIHCHRCGCSIDVSRPVCDHCGTPIRYRQRLYLDELSF